MRLNGPCSQLQSGRPRFKKVDAPPPSRPSSRQPLEAAAGSKAGVVVVLAKTPRHAAGVMRHSCLSQPAAHLHADTALIAQRRRRRNQQKNTRRGVSSNRMLLLRNSSE